MPIYKLNYTPDIQKNIELLKKSGEKQALKKLDILFKELEIHPKTGTGKPEQLKGFSDKDIWSRRITDKHRLVYEIQEEVVIVLILSAYGHYKDR